MDVHDISSIDEYVASLLEIKANFERMLKRKGEVPTDHLPAWILVPGFMMSLTPIPQGAEQHVIITTQVPPPYPPSVRPAEELTPIAIRQMALETHHRGRRVILRLLTPPSRLNAVMGIVEDEEGMGVLLQLYNQPREVDVPASETVRVGRILMIKEPYFKATATDKMYSIRVDHVGDMVWLEEGDHRIPKKWRKPATLPDGGSLQIRREGNEAVQKQKWAEAERLYSSAIKLARSPEEISLACLNRSLVNLKLGRAEKALADAQRSDATVPSEKGLFRAARALYELGRFEQCLARLEALAAAYPKTTVAKPEMDRAQARLREQHTGDYDFRSMYEQAKATPPIIDCATYVGPIKVRPSPSRGHGLFVTEKVEAGQLLLCEKASGYVYQDEDTMRHRSTVLMNLSTMRMTMGGQADLVTQLVQKAWHNPKASRAFLQLYRSEYQGVEVDKVDALPVVDSFLVERIISLNSFGAPRTTRSIWQQAMDGKRPAELAFSTAGIWTLASYINHSCDQNCKRSFIGDMMILRATRDLEPGAELVFEYADVADTPEKMAQWGFECVCHFCTQRKATGKATLRAREKLCEEFKHGGMEVRKMQQLIKKLAKTYTGNGARTDMAGPYMVLAVALEEAGRAADAIPVALESLQALGYVIEASIPAPGKEGKFDVRAWGVRPELAAGLFVLLYRAFATVAAPFSRAPPDVCKKLKEYLEKVYSMKVGEAATMLEDFPDLLELESMRLRGA